MLAKNVTMEDLQAALDTVNEKFDGNIRFKSVTPQGRNIRFTLTVNNSRKAGSRISASPFGNRRRICAACWHVHGEFFDALPAAAVIVAAGEKIRPGDPWQDRNIGSQIYPMYYSEACDCN